jgi:hypothetical protein
MLEVFDAVLPVVVIHFCGRPDGGSHEVTNLGARLRFILSFRVRSDHRATAHTNHGQISEETINAAAQPHARTRFTPPKRPGCGLLLVQQGRGRATHHQNGSSHFFCFLFSSLRNLR